jgi:polyhydroxyalkanoate synthesis regulator phasin
VRSASGGGSGGEPARMADANPILESVEKLGLAALGAVALTADRADALADELAARGGLRRDEVRAAIEDMTLRWRGEAARVGERSGVALEGVLQQLGLVTRADFEELELRVAQLEHRIKLVEGAPRAVPAPPH